MDWNNNVFNLISPSIPKREKGNEEDKLDPSFVDLNSPFYSQSLTKLKNHDKEKEESMISPLFGKEAKHLEDRYVAISPMQHFNNHHHHHHLNGNKEEGMF